jgi:hypothetical protein
MIHDNSWRSPIFLSLVLCSLFFVSCNRLQALPDANYQNGEQWLSENPHVKIGTGESSFILAKPSSSLIVYALGVLTLGVSFHFFRTRAGQKSRFWWGFALLVWGVGTFLAGTSYQAFAYEIKCAGQDFCSFTSWFEILYLILEVLSINAILMAVSSSLVKGKALKWIKNYALVNVVLYFLVVLIGAFIPYKPFITFETMLLFCAPGALLISLICIKRWIKAKDSVSRAFVIACLLLFMTTVFYYIYYLTGMTNILWEKGFWFSANDVLHLGLMVWMMYLWRKLSLVVFDGP